MNLSNRMFRRELLIELRRYRLIRVGMRLRLRAAHRRPRKPA